MKPIEWLWPDPVAIRKLTMLTGTPPTAGLVTLDMASRISTGRWPSQWKPCAAQNILLIG